jgi:thiosulfate/3-mercaptopyruvate sulfurtransferase
MIDQIIDKGIIEPEQLKIFLETKQNLILLDATFMMPGSGDPHAGYVSKRIQGARFFDIEAISDHSTSLPHMLPSPAQFEQAVSALGIGNDDLVVIYGQTGMIMGPCRAWWTFRVFGHDRVCVLNGGLPAWIAAGLPVEDGKSSDVSKGGFKARFRPELVRDLAEVKLASCDAAAVILDARVEPRFAGTAPEPRPGLRSGHIPNSRNVSATSLVSHETGKILPENQLCEIFDKAGIKAGDSVIASCGSGVTACSIAFALYVLGWKDVAVYDGSWAEWGQEGLDMSVSAF